MTAPRRTGASANDSAESLAGGHLWKPSLATIAYLLLALALVVGGGLYVWLAPSSALGLDEGTSATAAASASSTTTTASANPGGTWPPPSVVRAAPQAALDGKADPTQDISSLIKPGENPSMPEVIERLRKAGVTGGLAAFSPPGTRPPLIGLAVPEDFVLPEGYVRHHQATDDGQRIEAILMFAPDRQFFDAANRPITVPANRVVPPEHAPAGLPIRLIVLPKPIDPAAR